MSEELRQAAVRRDVYANVIARLVADGKPVDRRVLAHWLAADTEYDTLSRAQTGT
jgi:hypothetical protein